MVTTYTYSASFDVAFLEGGGTDIRRMWLDGREVPLGALEVVHEDGLLKARARDLDLTDYGNRIPAIEVEVYRHGVG